MPNNLNYLQSNENMLTLRTSDYMTKYYIESIRNIKKGIAAKQARQNNELFDEVYSIFFVNRVSTIVKSIQFAHNSIS